MERPECGTLDPTELTKLVRLSICNRRRRTRGKAQHSDPRHPWRRLRCGCRREDKQHNQEGRYSSGKSFHSITVSSQRKITRSQGRAPSEKSKAASDPTGGSQLSGLAPGCVKTRLSQGRAELFSQLPSPNRSCQCNRFSTTMKSRRKFYAQVQRRSFHTAWLKTGKAQWSKCFPLCP